jgi:hypothetical protein
MIDWPSITTMMAAYIDTTKPIPLKDLVAPLITFVGALIALSGVYLTVRRTRQNQDRKQAYEAFDNYLKEAFANPEYANGQLINKDRNLIPERYSQADKKFYQYEWLVARLLAAGEQILAVDNSAEWRITIKSQLQKHRLYLSSRFFDEKPYSRAIRPIICEVIKEQKAKQRSPQQEGKSEAESNK